MCDSVKYMTREHIEQNTFTHSNIVKRFHFANLNIAVYKDINQHATGPYVNEKTQAGSNVYQVKLPPDHIVLIYGTVVLYKHNNILNRFCRLK